MKTYPYLFLDLDGTISDSAPGIVRSAQYALEAFGIPVSNPDDLLCFVGPPLEDSFQEFYHFTPQQADEAVKKYRERYEVTGVYENGPSIPGITDSFSSAQRRAGDSDGGDLEAATHGRPSAASFRHCRPFRLVGGRDDATRRTKEEVIRYVMQCNGLTDLSQIVMIATASTTSSVPVP